MSFYPILVTYLYSCSNITINVPSSLSLGTTHYLLHPTRPSYIIGLQTSQTKQKCWVVPSFTIFTLLLILKTECNWY